jgi:hypothetical protein
MPMPAITFISHHISMSRPFNLPLEVLYFVEIYIYILEVLYFVEIYMCVCVRAHTLEEEDGTRPCKRHGPDDIMLIKCYFKI